jgi:hypothetical protein
MSLVSRLSQRRISISRSLSAVLLLMTIAAAAVVFDEKREASAISSEVARFRAKIEHEKERISELKAEWSLLDQPARLQSIVEHNPETFGLAPMRTEQIGRVDDLPWPSVEAPKDGKEAKAPHLAKSGDAPARPSAASPPAAAPPRTEPAPPVEDVPEEPTPSFDEPRTTGSITPPAPRSAVEWNR